MGGENRRLNVQDMDCDLCGLANSLPILPLPPDHLVLQYLVLTALGARILQAVFGTVSKTIISDPF